MMNSNSYRIRLATSADIALIQRLAEATWGPTYNSILTVEQVDFMFDQIYTEEALRRQMQEGQVFILLFDGDEAVGFASYSEKVPEQHIYKLNKLYMLPTCQGKGLGKRLIEAVEEKVKDGGARVLDLNVNRYNKAKQFYERCGYQVHTEEDIPIGPYWMNDFVMRKHL
jgi:GNAT superfamily N-acetyltransferase